MQQAIDIAAVEVDAVSHFKTVDSFHVSAKIETMVPIIK